jgi:hypothetical protein
VGVATITDTIIRFLPKNNSDECKRSTVAPINTGSD